jgi:hypothetical protein
MSYKINSKQMVFIFVIIIIVILSIINLFDTDNFTGFTREGFSYESNCVPENIYPNSISKLDKSKNFMLRDIKTNYWLIIDGGDGKFVPSRFGVTFILSNNPTEDLPLRLVNQPNTYILAGYTGNGLRAVSNPYTEFFKVEVLIYKQRNILAYMDEGNNQHFIVVEPSGYNSSTTNPDAASMFEMVFV